MKTKVENELNQKYILKEYLSPDCCSIPIPEDSFIYVSSNSSVLKNEKVLRVNDNFITSPISGIILGTKVISLPNNLTTAGIIIQNDYKEKLAIRKGSSKDLSEYDKELMIETLKNYGGVSTENHYFSELLKIEPVEIIINGIEMYKYALNNNYLLEIFNTEVLDAIEKFRNIMRLPKIYFVADYNDTNNIPIIKEYMGTYPQTKLKFSNNSFKQDLKDKICKELFKSNFNDKILFLNLSDLLNIYQILKRERSINEKIVTIYGNNMNKPLVINTKLGAFILPMLKEFVPEKLKTPYKLYINSNEVDQKALTNLIITNEIDVIIIKN